MERKENTWEMKGFTKITATELRAQMRDILERARFQGERFVVYTHGKPMAMVVGVRGSAGKNSSMLEFP